MQHEAHATEVTTVKSSQTNGFGLLLLAVVAVCIALFCWNMWKEGDKEAQHYRFEKTKSHEAGEHKEAHH